MQSTAAKSLEKYVCSRFVYTFFSSECMKSNSCVLHHIVGSNGFDSFNGHGIEVHICSRNFEWKRVMQRSHKCAINQDNQLLYHAISTYKRSFSTIKTVSKFSYIFNICYGEKHTTEQTLLQVNQRTILSIAINFNWPALHHIFSML